MLGIGHRQDKYTKIKLMAEKAKIYNQKYDSMSIHSCPARTATAQQAERMTSVFMRPRCFHTTVNLCKQARIYSS